MRSSSSLKQVFLKKWVMGLQVYSASKKNMSLIERKKAIKLCADVAMASARNASTSWSRALIAYASKDCDNKTVVDRIVGAHDSEKIKKSLVITRKEIALKRSKKILKKSRRSIRRVKKIAPHHHEGLAASSIAKRLVKKRTQVLKRLVPGGESMDEFSLMEETLDYIVSLRAQIDVMRHLANATEHLNGK